MQKRLHEAVFLTKRQLAFEQVAEFVVEFVHTTGSVDDFLSTGVERVAQGANLNVEAVFFHCGFGHEFVAARAGNVDFVVVRVNTLFHLISFRTGVLPVLQLSVGFSLFLAVSSSGYFA